MHADPAVDGTRSEVFICVSLERKILLIGGSIICRRDEEVRLLGHELPAPEGRSSQHARLGLGRDRSVATRRSSSVLSGTGKDDAGHRSDAAHDR